MWRINYTGELITDLFRYLITTYAASLRETLSKQTGDMVLSLNILTYSTTT